MVLFARNLLTNKQIIKKRLKLRPYGSSLTLSYLHMHTVWPFLKFSDLATLFGGGRGGGEVKGWMELPSHISGRASAKTRKWKDEGCFTRCFS